MPTLTVVFDDKVIIKDGVALHFEGDGTADFDAVVTAQSHTAKWAIQWDGTTGSIEDADPTNDHILPTQAQIDAYIAAFDAEKERLKQKEKTDYLALDADAEARIVRDGKLTETDWWAMADRTMTAEQTAYRQALRDLPASADWNPTMSWDDDTWTGSLTGVTWPTKP